MKEFSRLALYRVAAAMNIVVLLVGGTQPSIGSPVTLEEPAIILGGGNPKEMTVPPLDDLRGIGLAEGISIDEAIQLTLGQDEFATILLEVRAKSMDTFAGAGWEPGEGYRAWIAFAGQASSEALSLIDTLGFPVLVRFDAPLSEDEQINAQQHVLASLRESPGFTAASTSIDPITGRLTVVGDFDAERQADFEKTSLLLPEGITLTVENSDDFTVLPEVVRGGVQIGVCTTGFAVFRNSTRGVFTAGHCADGSQAVTGSSVNAVFQGEHEGAYGDVQWHSSTDTTSNSIAIDSSGTLRAMTGNGYTAVGMSVCNYGRTRSNAACTTIESVNDCFADTNDSGAPITLCRMMHTNGAFTNGGDSGGPWYLNNTAYGIHFGKWGLRSGYSAVYNAQSILSVTLKIN